MATLDFFTSDSLDNNRDESGLVHDSLGDNLGPGTENRGYHLGSLTRGLVAYYPLDEGSGSIVGDSALGNDGTITGATWNGSGQIGSDCLSFDGTDDYVDIPNPFPDNATGRTNTAWIRTDSNSTRQRIIQLKYHGLWGILDRSEGGTEYELCWRINDGPGTTITSGVVDIQTAQWYFCAAVWDGSNHIIYIDGVEMGRFSGDGNWGNESTLESYIGAEQGSSIRYYDGLVDDVRIYDRPLSGPEIGALYNLTNPSTVTDEDTLQ